MLTQADIDAAKEDSVKSTIVRFVTISIEDMLKIKHSNSLLSKIADFMAIVSIFSIIRNNPKLKNSIDEMILILDKNVKDIGKIEFHQDKA